MGGDDPLLLRADADSVSTPAAIIGAVGSWEHKWNWSAPTAQGGSGGSAGSREPDNKALQNKLDSVNGQVKRLQAAADRAVTSPKQAAEEQVTRPRRPIRLSGRRRRWKARRKGRRWRKGRRKGSGGGAHGGFDTPATKRRGHRGSRIDSQRARILRRTLGLPTMRCENRFTKNRWR